MRPRTFVACAVAATLAPLAARPLAAQIHYPPTAVHTVVDTLHGVAIPDPYRWLEDQHSPATRAWIDRENAFTDSVMAGVRGHAALTHDLGRLMRVDQEGAPTVRGDRYFFTRKAADQDLSVIYMREGADGTDIPLVDPNTMEAGVPLSVHMVEVSEDGKLLAYGIRHGGEDETVTRFYDVPARRVLAEALPKMRVESFSFTPDDKAFFYSRATNAGPRLYYHAFGWPADSAQLVFGDGITPDKYIGSTLSTDGRWLLITVAIGTSGGNQLYLKDVAHDGPVLPMVTETGKNYRAAFAGDTIVIQTDWKAPNGRVMVADPASPGRSHWKEIVPEGKNAIQGFSLAGHHVWVRYLENVIGHIRGFDLAGTPFREIAMPSIGTVSGLSGRWDQDQAFFSFASYNVPTTIYRYGIAADARSVWWREDAPFASADYEVKQVWYTSKDGTRVPMFVASKKGITLDGNNPVFLTGYGGFDISMTPRFSAEYAVWMEHGGVLAVPNLRGGGEFGEAWHEAGMFGKKQNVFDDFIAAAEWLITNKYTNPNRLAIAGASNGGLLVGAALTQRPDLFRAVVCGYPLLDMLRFQKFLIGSFWVSEYGSADNPEQFKYLLEYSPYQNVKPGTAYPAVLLLTGDGDTRVAPLHARKMTARLQAATSSDRPILLHYDTEAGHSGGLPVSKQIQDTARSLLFVMWQLGMTP
ncbi:MAG TPA: prolyl oligopeptidase family serine peptidase [Gemmatimonadales bacterium]|nr:prolyl oligopeptidase family serine peptidase [Gemmatimonadales bacterium]